MHQELTENDFARRLTFCQWAQNRVRENQSFFKFVLFTDESTFHRNGFVNRHNFHFYATENPHAVHISNFQHKWSLNVWGGIVHDYVIGPFFFEEALTGERFLLFMREELPHLLNHVPEFVKNMWFQLDGAPAHFHRNVRAYLEENFPQKWIGRGGPVNWPARSPDLTSMDFYLWGYVKSKVYHTPATTIKDMKERIREALRSITPVTLFQGGQNFLSRIEACINKNGRHFEQFL